MKLSTEEYNREYYEKLLDNRISQDEDQLAKDLRKANVLYMRWCDEVHAKIGGQVYIIDCVAHEERVVAIQPTNQNEEAMSHVFSQSHNIEMYLVRGDFLYITPPFESRAIEDDILTCLFDKGYVGKVRFVYEKYHRIYTINASGIEDSIQVLFCRPETEKRITITNTADPVKVTEYLESNEGKQTICEVLEKEAGKVSKRLGLLPDSEMHEGNTPQWHTPQEWAAKHAIGQPWKNTLKPELWEEAKRVFHDILNSKPGNIVMVPKGLEINPYTPVPKAAGSFTEPMFQQGGMVPNKENEEKEEPKSFEVEQLEVKPKEGPAIICAQGTITFEPTEEESDFTEDQWQDIEQVCEAVADKKIAKIIAEIKDDLVESLAGKVQELQQPQQPQPQNGVLYVVLLRPYNVICGVFSCGDKAVDLRRNLGKTSGPGQWVEVREYKLNMPVEL